MECKIAVISGDGIGPEIVREARKVLDVVADKYGHTFNYTDVLMGGASIDVHGIPLTDEAIATAKASDAVLMGSIGGDAKVSPWYKLEPSKRPEAGLLKIRKELNLFANLRPAYLYDELKAACPLRDDIIGDGFDMKVLGCSLGRIRDLFLLEAGFIGLAGGTIGLLLSFGISAIINTLLADSYYSRISYIPFWLTAVALVFAVLIGMLAGLMPALRAMKLSALSALRNE